MFISQLCVVTSSHLESAVASLKVVMRQVYMFDCCKLVTLCFSHVNEDKRKTEAQVKMFEILRDIEQCPVSYCASLAGTVLVLQLQLLDM